MKYKKETITELEIKEFAILGFTTKIKEAEKAIKKGQIILSNRANGIKKDKSPLTDEGIEKVIQEKKIEILKLSDKKNQIEWELI